MAIRGVQSLVVFFSFFEGLLCNLVGATILIFLSYVLIFLCTFFYLISGGSSGGAGAGRGSSPSYRRDLAPPKLPSPLPPPFPKFEEEEEQAILT